MHIFTISDAYLMSLHDPDLPAKMQLVYKAASLEFGGGFSEETWGQEREASDTFVMRVPTCHERSWVILRKSLQAKKKTLETKCAPSLLQRKSNLTLWWLFCCIYWVNFSSCDGESPVGNEGAWASGCRGGLELWLIESFSGLGSRSADEARLNNANRSWKICTCAGSPSTPATPGLVQSWESSYFYMCAGRHTHTNTYALYMHRKRR